MVIRRGFFLAIDLPGHEGASNAVARDEPPTPRTLFP